MRLHLLTFIIFTISSSAAIAFEESKEAKPLHESVRCLASKIKESSYDLPSANCAKNALALSKKFGSNWDAGNAIHKANLVLGMIALRSHDLKGASEFLLNSAKSNGSPQLNSFGPNMTLAQALLREGQKQIVLDFFGKCKSFWKDDDGKLTEWTKDISSDRAPNFGSNLNY